MQRRGGTLLNDFIEYYSNVWLKQAIKDNNCKNEKELYEKTYMEIIQRKHD